jgi:hypothetical protein
VVGARPGGKSERYVRLIAAYVAHFLRQGTLYWGIDQLAMYGAFAYLRAQGAAPALALLDDHAVDYTYYDDGIVWCNSGKNKFTQFQSTEGRPDIEDVDRAKYIDLFKAYAGIAR